MNGLPPDTDEYVSAATDYGAMPGAFAPPEMDASEPQPVQYRQEHRALPPAPQAQPAPSHQQSAPMQFAAAYDIGSTGFNVPQVPQPSQIPGLFAAEVGDQGKMLGFSTVVTALGMLIGVRLGGGYGAVAGSLFAGSAVNAYRASLFARRDGEAAKKEAVLSGTYAVLAAGLGGAVLWYTREQRSSSALKPNRDDSCGRSSLTSNTARSCGIRAIV